MTTHFDSYDNCAKKIIADVGKTIVIAVPLGLGKPVGVLNALCRLAIEDKSVNLTIVTGLTLARPLLKNKLEKKLIEPILDRILKDYEDPLYEKYRELQKLPSNINVIEFFLTPGKFLHNAYVQQNYISSCYTSVARDVINLSVNVLAQQVAPSSTQANLFSLSCNTDLFHDVLKGMKKLSSSGKKMAVIAEVNSNLPFMYGSVAEVDGSIFSDIVDTKKYRSLFAIPREQLFLQDHLIGLYTSTLIKDDGCLQIGIGQLSNALANALIFRHNKNTAYRDLINQLDIQKKSEQLISEAGSLDMFDKGLYASTEMLSDEYMQLYKAGVLKKKVYDHIGLQKLLNNQAIGETVTPEMINTLIEHRIINPILTSSNIQFLQSFGIFKTNVVFDNNNLILLSGESIPADLASPKSKQDILDKCLGEKLKSGKMIHAGFYFGSLDFYSDLHKLSYDESQLIEMTSISRTNALSWSPKLLALQRQRARFVNSSIMVTLLGGIISDGLKDYQEVSGVGGQYDFVSMANQLKGAHSIINCRSTRRTKNGVQSNIVWDYSNSTISRYLRDFIVTEYGIADCRSKTDAEVIKVILNITDSRFQMDLLQKAKQAGKLQQDYQIPTLFLNNYPETIKKVADKNFWQDYFQPYPFGSDLTSDEQVIANALLYLKNSSTLKLIILIIFSLFFFKSDTSFLSYLNRMELGSVKNIKDWIYKKLLKYVIYLRRFAKT